MKTHVVLIFMTVCAFTAPMTLKEKRDLNNAKREAASTVNGVVSTEGGAASTKGGAASTEGATSTEGGAAGTEATGTSTPATTNRTEICAPQTPCAWSAYHTYTKDCICGPGTECFFYEDDKQDFTYVYRCRAPHDDTNTVLKRST